MPPIEKPVIGWNEVTWYSKVLAILLFVAFVCGAFFFGIYYQKQLQPQDMNRVPDERVILNNQIESSVQNGQKFVQPEDLVFVYGANGYKTEFAKDSTQVYVLTEPQTSSPVNLTKIDASSFEALGSKNLYFKDKNHVYFDSPQDFAILAEADTDTFSLVSDTVGQETDYARDKNFVFHGHKLIDSADPNTFIKIASSTFAKDGTRVFSEHIHYDVSVVEGANPANFIPLNASDGHPSAYGKDAQNIYCGLGKIEGADFATFFVEGAWSAKDKNQQYSQCSVYDPANP